MIIMPSMGGSDMLALPDYVVAATGPDGEAYFKVPEEYATAVAGALNSFQMTSRFPLNGAIDSLTAERASGVGDFAGWVSEWRIGRGIMMAGDVFSGDAVAVAFVDRFTVPGQGFYILAPPDGGWPVASGQPWTGAEIGPMATRAVAGIRWGAMIGGVVGLAVIATYAMRSR